MKQIHYLFLLLICLTMTNEIVASDRKNAIFTHGPYLQKVTQTGATIVFATDLLIVPGVMIKSTNGEFELIQNSHDGLIDVGSNIHKIRIDNLLPGNEYEYRLFACKIEDYQPYKSVYGDTVLSSSYKFRTFSTDQDKVNFTVFCDVHDKADKLGSYLYHNNIEQQDCYFLNGDIMGHIEEEAQLFSSFLDTCVSTFAREKPFFYVRGNHETRGKFARNLKKYLDFPNDKYYYAQTIGPVRFVVLDGGEDKPDTSKEYSGMADFDRYRFEELAWLKDEVCSEEFKNAPFRIVIIHMPIIESEKNWYGMAFLAKHFGPVLRDADIDLMISGHTHRNAWIESGKSGFDYPVMISSNNHFIEAEVDENEISLLLKNTEGKVEKRYVIEND